MQTIKYHVTVLPEYSAGILGSSNTVTIEISDDTTIDNECIDHFRMSIRDWFDADLVETESEYKDRMEKENLGVGE